MNSIAVVSHVFNNHSIFGLLTNDCEIGEFFFSKVRTLLSGNESFLNWLRGGTTVTVVFWAAGASALSIIVVKFVHFLAIGECEILNPIIVIIICIDL